MISRRPLVLMFGEFSRKTIDGRITSIARNSSHTSPDCFPPIPSPVPAHEISWQGNPAAMQSIRPFQGVGSKFRMSAHSTCISGNHPDSRRTRHRLSSISIANTDSCPNISEASIPPPPPAKKCPTLIIAATRPNGCNDASGFPSASISWCPRMRKHWFPHSSMPPPTRR